MGSHIFLSYSRRDVEHVRELYQQLVRANFPVWMDERNLLPGQNWEREIKKAIRESVAVLICLSSKWVESRGYIQKELKLALNTLQEMPEGKIFLIPVKLDVCTLPNSISHLHWIEISECDGLTKLQTTLRSITDSERDSQPLPQGNQVSAYQEWLEHLTATGGIIHDDPWSRGSSKEEVVLKQFLKAHLNEGLDLLERSDWQGIIDLWEPVLDNPCFRVDYSEWSDKPLFRLYVHVAKAHLFVSHMQLGQTADSKIHVPTAFLLLEELLEGPAYSMKGASHDRLATDVARIQNENYRDILNSALEWYKGWEGTFSIYGIETAREQLAKKRIHDRLSEIDFLMRLRRGGAGG